MKKENYRIDYCYVSSGTGVVPTATVRLIRGSKAIKDSCCGKGPVGAVFNTIDRITRTRGRLTGYSLKSLNGSADGVGEATIEVTFGKKKFISTATSTDVIEASAKAYLSCVNRHLAKHRWRRRATK